MIAAKRNTARRWPATPTPLVQENGRTTAFFRLRPVPIGQQHDIILWIGTPQPFVAKTVGRAHHQVIIRVARIIRPQVIWPDWPSPVGQFAARNAVGAVKQANDAMHTRRRGAIAFAFG